MGFLDMFDDPNIMQRLLGISQPPQNGVVPRGGNPNPMAYTPNQTGIGAYMGEGAMMPENMAPKAPPPTPPSITLPDAMAGPAAAPGGPGLPPPNGAGVPLPTPRPPEADAALSPGSVPLPTPRPPEMPPGAQPTAAVPPMNLAPQPPPMPPVGDPRMAGVPQSPGGGLAAAFGLTPRPDTRPDAIRSTLAGVGRGLTAVGNMPRGASPGQAIAAGLGGSLTGNIAQQDKEKTDNFNQLSATFKDVVLANKDKREEGEVVDKNAYRRAQSEYLLARAKNLMTGGPNGTSRGYQNTPEFKVLRVEEDAAKWEKGQQIILQKRWQQNGATPEQQEKDLEVLARKVEQFKQNLYKATGIDPKNAEKIKSMGTSADNPFDTKGMSIDDFHARVPMGGWYKDQHGVPRQRTVPPPGSNAQPQPATPSAAAPNLDDQAAMNDAA